MHGGFLFEKAACANGSYLGRSQRCLTKQQLLMGTSELRALPKGLEIPNHLCTLLFTHIHSHTVSFCQVK